MLAASGRQELLDECAAFLLHSGLGSPAGLVAIAEQLLELVDDQQQPGRIDFDGFGNLRKAERRAAQCRIEPEPAGFRETILRRCRRQCARQPVQRRGPWPSDNFPPAVMPEEGHDTGTNDG
jgi:hypothetical protein